LLLLGCAVLMPEQRATVERMAGAYAGEEEGQRAQEAAQFKPLAPGRSSDTFSRIAVLSETDMKKLGIACSPDVPEVLKADVLKDIEAKVGGLSEADLSADVRALLAELRRQVRGEDASAKPASATVEGGSPDQQTSVARSEQGANPLTAQEAVALARAHFPDVAEALHRYYVAK
jgi:hypothetical protein